MIFLSGGGLVTSPKQGSSFQLKKCENVKSGSQFDRQKNRSPVVSKKIL